MSDEAPNITDCIVPNAPVRQGVLSLPFELRGLCATKPDVLTALGRIFSEEVARATKRLASVVGAETGAVSFPQRFGGSLHLHVPFHLLAVDAVFEKYGEGVRVHEAPPPAKTDVADVVRRVHDRALVWLRRHRYLDERGAEDRGNEPRPKCAAKMRVLATLTDPSVVKKILSHIGLRTEPLSRARTRDPTGQMDLGFDAA